MKRKKENPKELVPFEKSRRIIYLEGRGKEKKKISVGSILFALLGLLCILYCAGIGIAGFGTLFFLTWGVLGIFCILTALILGNKRLLGKIPGWVKGIVMTLFVLGMALFITVEGLILKEFNAQAAPGAEYCIVLGAQWKNEGPGEVLRRRLDKAISYLSENPDTMVIVSGGRGSNEPVAEAVGMKGYLMEAGIAEERILVEDTSSNTYENLMFSGRLFDKQAARAVIVTNNFHVFRAVKIAEKQGYGKVEGLAASSVEGMLPNNLLREFMGVVKDFIVGNL